MVFCHMTAWRLFEGNGGLVMCLPSSCTLPSPIEPQAPGTEDSVETWHVQNTQGGSQQLH